MTTYQGHNMVNRTERDTKGALRAQMIAAAREPGATSLIVKRKRYSGGNGHLEATSELITKIENAINGWHRYFEIAGVTKAGNVIVAILAEPPEF